MTGIEWTDETLNPVTGCDRVSEGCANCYIERTVPFRMAGRRFDQDGHIDLAFHRGRLERLLRWRKPRRVFINSLSDLFHPDVGYDLIVDVFAHMAGAPQHQCQVLTKRPQRMASIVGDAAGETSFRQQVQHRFESLALSVGFRNPDRFRWPIPNAWLGTSIELDKYTFRADHLRATPAAVRWLSLEPLLGPLPSLDLAGIDWVVVGGGSGPRARPMHPGWVRDIRDRCVDAGVAFFFKQWGDWAPAGPMYDTSDRTHLVLPDGTDRGIPWGGWALDRPEAEPMRRFGKRAAGRELDGRTWDQFPDDAERGAR